MTRTALTYEELTGAVPPSGLIDNSAFMPAPESGPANHQIGLELKISAAPIRSDKSILSAEKYNNLRADLFPVVTLRITGKSGAMIPNERDLICDAEGESYWDLTVSPGKVWSEEADRGMSRAVFPFQLSNIFENDTHHGLATFLYDDTSATPIRFQIAVQTKTFVVPGEFDAWGLLPVEAEPVPQTETVFARVGYYQEADDRLPLKPWSDLPGEVPPELLGAIDEGIGSDTEIVSGLVIDKEIYATECKTRAGAFPFPRGMKFGVWSATKTAFGMMACLRLAQVTGEDPRKALISDLIEETLGQDQWEAVTVGHCLNMATGIGTAAPFTEGTTVFSDYLLEESQAAESELGRKSFDRYFAWFLAPSQTEKNHAALACPGYPWGPDKVVRYRDQDLYLAGAAMDAWYKQRFGPHARLWHLVQDEIYQPAKIHYAVKFETIETVERRTVPLTDAGLLLTMDNIARLGQLIHDGGRTTNHQILDEAMLAEVFDPRRKKGLPTGRHTADGEIHYQNATWHMPYKSNRGELLWLPMMVGYGGQIIQILPNGMTAFRFGYDSSDTEDRYDFLKLARIADAIEPF